MERITASPRVSVDLSPAAAESLPLSSVRQSQQRLETLMPKRLSSWAMIRNDIMASLCCVQEKYINVKKDGLCLFRCQLVTQRQDISFAYRETSEIKEMVLTHFSDDIDAALIEALEYVGYTLNQHPELREGLRYNIENLWHPNPVNNLFSYYFGEPADPQEQKENAGVFSDVFCQRLLARFANPHIVYYEHHFLLNRAALSERPQESAVETATETQGAGSELE